MTIPTLGGGAGPAASFAVTAAPNVALDGNNTGKTSFTVTNLTGRPVRARVNPRGGGGAADSWFAVTGAAELPMAVGATATVEIVIAVPRGAPGGQRSLVIEVVAEDDTEVVTGQSVSFTVNGSGAGKSPLLLIIILVLVVLLVAAAAVWYFFLRTPAEPAEPSPSPSPSASASLSPTPSEPATITNNRLPKISGPTEVNGILTVMDQGSWSSGDLTYAEQWQRCTGASCDDISGATNDSYTTTNDDVGKNVRIAITVTDADGATGSANSEPIGPIVLPADACQDGFQWRLAGEGDHVCVTPETAAQVAADNAVKESRWTPGAYGRHTCISGYVWREAYSGDDVCVTPDVRSQAAADNAAGPSRVRPH
jgi:cytoskeletal protein RodZ